VFVGFDFVFLVGVRGFGSFRVQFTEVLFFQNSYENSYEKKNDLIQFLNTGQSKLPIGVFSREHTGSTRPVCSLTLTSFFK